MWERITSIAKAIAAVVAAMSALGLLAGWLNQALLDHLDLTFATKVDVQRLEQKIDKLDSKLDTFNWSLPHVTRPSSQHPR